MKLIAPVVAAASMFASSPSFGAVSGYWDSSKVIHAILGSDRVADALRQQPIESVNAVEDGYRIASKDCFVDVRVERTEPDMPGPTHFILDIGRGQCS